jgi:7-cyano-7-deazaguanine synthase
MFQTDLSTFISPTVVVVLSGGQDSTTCLFWALKQGFNVHAVTFDYGQRHKREIEAAKKVASLAGVLSHEIIELGAVLKGSSPLVSDGVLEQYASHQVLPGGLEKTFVPMRNQLFLTIAANRAYVLGATALVTGVCEEDYGGYPDCRTQFIKALTYACQCGTFIGPDGELLDFSILTPLMKLTKKETVERALLLPGCYDALAWTHTSYDGAYPPVGKDHATLLRAKGFEEAMIPDPLVLRSVYEGLMDYPDTPNYSAEVIDKHKRLLDTEEWAIPRTATLAQAGAV